MERGAYCNGDAANHPTYVHSENDQLIVTFIFRHKDHWHRFFRLQETTVWLPRRATNIVGNGPWHFLGPADSKP